MSIEILHVKSKDPLQDFSRQIFQILDINEIEQRYSDNYPEGTYFKGKKGNVDIKISHEDDQGFDDWDYWVTVTQHSENLAMIQDIVQKLSRAGYEVYKGRQKDIC